MQRDRGWSAQTEKTTHLNPPSPKLEKQAETNKTFIHGDAASDQDGASMKENDVVTPSPSDLTRSEEVTSLVEASTTEGGWGYTCRWREASGAARRELWMWRKARRGVIFMSWTRRNSMEEDVVKPTATVSNVFNEMSQR